MAAIEFALMAPVMITFYFGTTELTDGLSVYARAANVASTAADLVAQEKSINNAGMTDVFSALNAIIYPYASAGAKITITSVIDAGSNQTKVAWSDAQNTTARSVGSTVTLPTGLITSGSGASVIMAEVVYTYASPAGKLIYGSIPISDTFYLKPRRVAQIARTAN